MPTRRPLPDNTQHSQQTSMPEAGFELAIPASERPQTHALDREATRIGSESITVMKIPVTKFKTYFQFILTAFKTN